VAKLVYALVLGTSGAICGGSSPLSRTKVKVKPGHFNDRALLLESKFFCFRGLVRGGSMYLFPFLEINTAEPGSRVLSRFRPKVINILSNS